MKKVKIITGNTNRISSYEEKETGIQFGTELFEHNVAQFINMHTVLEIHYSIQYVNNITTKYSAMIIYEEAVYE